MVQHNKFCPAASDVRHKTTQEGPQIFFDLLSGKGGADCDCACPSSNPTLDQLLLAADTRLQRHAQMRYIELTEHYRVVFVPSISSVAVLNNEACQILEQFREPQYFGTLPLEVLKYVEQFFQLGLLQSTNTPSPLFPIANELIAWLHVTNACNLRCTYCYINKNEESMSAETAFAAVDAILRSAQIHQYNSISLKYAGGESTLNVERIEDIHAYACEQAGLVGITVRGVVLSNGVGLTRRKLEVIGRLGLRLMISLDGTQEYHDLQRPRLGGQGSFHAVIASIERAREMQLDLTISVTVTSTNIEGLPSLIDWLLKKTLHFTLNFYRDCDSSKTITDLHLDEQHIINGMRAAYKVIEELLPPYSLLSNLLDRANMGVSHQRTCAAGENYLVIDHQGNIGKCQMEIAKPITTISANDPLQIIRLEPIGVQNLPVDQKEGCRTCEWKYWCSGGCALATFRATQRYDIRSPNCNIYKTLYPEVIRLEGLRLLSYAQQQIAMSEINSLPWTPEDAV